MRREWRTIWMAVAMRIARFLSLIVARACGRNFREHQTARRTDHTVYPSEDLSEGRLLQVAGAPHTTCLERRSSWRRDTAEAVHQQRERCCKRQRYVGVFFCASGNRVFSTGAGPTQSAPECPAGQI